ncbi:T9SS type A sorting domain-containing protein [Chryseobacterium sp. JUb7]|uniref:T9SS type A sorting domain-containing protein n=1 Tax=Chryseobacterium sp. JUb7 TaxID=2940599 RepID=UPI00216A9BBB|nr:T9SS type A sorting domain-containing protein [Chryseobacterium sp. JUb7]MCS3533113.1 hypothetical protein [Chryseobacterium sp. JUb7]
MKSNYSFAKIFALLFGTAFSGLNAQTYCNPSYPNGCSSWRITQVTIPSANFNNSFASGTCTSGRDRTSIVANLTPGSSYTINITTMGWIACAMAIDFNNDGDFNDAGEVLYLPAYLGNTATETYTGTFTIPASTAPGNYRMRIWNRLANSTNGTPADSACGTYQYGTWTDYTANISQQLGTSETARSTAKVYPNPTSDLLNIESENTITSVEIYDFNGRLLKNVSSEKSKKISIKISDLQSGTYTAKLKESKGEQNIKFIKN